MNGVRFQSATIPEQPKVDTDLLGSVAKQLMNRRRVTVQGCRLPVRRTSRQYLKTVSFPMDGREYIAIEQNAAKPSYWGSLARKGHQVVQFKDTITGRFVAVSVDGMAREYRAMRKPQATAGAALETLKE